MALIWRGLGSNQSLGFEGPVGSVERLGCTTPSTTDARQRRAPGITFELEGDANDYIGKGLSGGTIIVYKPKQACSCVRHPMAIGHVVTKHLVP